MTPDEVLSVARAGEKLGCTEALFSLGDKPELLFPEMRETLRHLGYKSTLHYLEAMCELVLRETSLLPHPNPGLLSAEWIARLAAVSPSMGLMLETTNAALLAPGAAHDNAPDKVPAKRLRTIEDAGKQNVPFTTGLLIGIGESPEDRVDTLLAIRDLHERYGHIQEVIVQNFRVKPAIPMANWPEPTRGEMLRTVAVARLLLPNVNIQAPPNLSAPYYEDLVDAGINDWGGISPLTPDFINPEKPWPHLEQLRLRTEAKGFAAAPASAGLSGISSARSASPDCLSEKLRAATGRLTALCASGGRHDLRAQRRHRRRQVRRRPAPGHARRRHHPDRQHWRRPALVGSLRFARHRFDHLRALRHAQPRARMGREGRHLPLPAGHGTTRRAHMVSHRRPRPGHAPAAFAPAGRRQDAFRCHRRDLAKNSA